MVSRAWEGWRVTADRHEVSSGLRKPVLNWVGSDGWKTLSKMNSPLIHVYVSGLACICLIFK